MLYMTGTTMDCDITIMQSNNRHEILVSPSVRQTTRIITLRAITLT
jgi:hypothetical protein